MFRSHNSLHELVDTVPPQARTLLECDSLRKTALIRGEVAAPSQPFADIAQPDSYLHDGHQPAYDSREPTLNTLCGAAMRFARSVRSASFGVSRAAGSSISCATRRNA